MNRISVITVKRPAPRKNQQGFSITELSFYAAVVAVVTVGVIAGYNSIARKNEVASAVQSVQTIAANLKSGFGASNNYAGINTAIVVASRAIPDNLADAGGTTATNIYSGAITVAPATLIAAGDATEMKWANVPSNQCIDFMLLTEGISRRMTVGTTTVKPTDGVLNIAQLTTACNQSARGSVSWVFGKT